MFKIILLIQFFGISNCLNFKYRETLFSPYNDSQKLIVKSIYIAPVMSKPNEDSEVIQRIRSDDQLRILEKSKEKENIKNKNDYWYKIIANEKEGYIFGDFLEEIPKTIGKIQDCKNDFPKNFDFGELTLGVDCETITFSKTHTFIYHFTGDCKGWGRYLKGSWKKNEKQLVLSAILTEGYKRDEQEYCSGSYYESYSPKQKKDCITKYKKMIIDEVNQYPTKFLLNGIIEIDSENMITVDINTIWHKNKQKEGLLKISNEKFSEFDSCGNNS